MASDPSVERRVLDLIAAYGSEPAAWPATEQIETYLVCLQSPTPAILDAIAAAGQIDDLLDTLPSPALPAGLEHLILEQAPDRSWWRQLREKMVGWTIGRAGWLPASGAFASLVIGLLVGLSGEAGTEADIETSDDAVIYAALGYTEFSGFLEDTD